MRMLAARVLGWITQVCTEAMGALDEDKHEVTTFAVSEHGQRTEVLKGILRHI
jgi:hypothetical protein